MSDFFVKKICDFHLKLDKMTEELPNCDSVPLAYDCESVVTMQTFSQLTESNVLDLVLSSAKKTCILYPIPTPVFVTCLDVLLPFLIKKINTSLMSGHFTGGWKCALVNPLLEKPGLDLSYKNDRPISNLHYVISSKLSGKGRIQTN